VRRLIFLICVVVLLCDLADDGGLGKVKCVAPAPAAHYSVASSSHASGTADPQVALPPAILRANPGPFPSQPASVEVPHNHNLSSFPFQSSSGGLPL
jgi:hypothetical protein